MIKLVRLDYRLLHGQVVFSWTGHVGAQRIIVVDDDAANDEMKKSALLLSKPAGVRVNIFTVDKAIAKMPKVEPLPCSSSARHTPRSKRSTTALWQISPAPWPLTSRCS